MKNIIYKTGERAYIKNHIKTFIAESILNQETIYHINTMMVWFSSLNTFAHVKWNFNISKMEVIK